MTLAGTDPTLVDRVRDALAAQYYRPIPNAVLQLRSVDEIISALGDPYTAYLAPADYELVRQETASRFSGIGSEPCFEIQFPKLM